MLGRPPQYWPSPLEVLVLYTQTLCQYINTTTSAKVAHINKKVFLAYFVNAKFEICYHSQFRISFTKSEKSKNLIEPC